MSERFRLSTMMRRASAGIVPLLLSVAFAHAVRPFTTRDAIEMTKFSRDARTEEQQNVHFSPGGKYFFTVTTRGLVERNQVESTIWLFDTSAIKNAFNDISSSRNVNITPRVLARIVSSSNDDAIYQAKWIRDEDTIAFLGRDKSSERRLFVVNVQTGQREQLSPEGQDVSDFDGMKGRFVFTAATPVGETDLYQSAGPSLPDIQIGTGVSLFSLLYPRWESFTFGISPQQLWQVKDGKSGLVVDPATTRPITLIRALPMSLLALSPTGRYAVAINSVREVPANWESYEPAFSFAKFSRMEISTRAQITDFTPAQYVLIDLITGRLSPLLNAPIGWSAGYLGDVFKAKWSADEHKVALSNTFMPVSNSTTPGVPRSPLRPCVAIVEIATHDVQCALQTTAPEPNKDRRMLRDLEWRDSDGELLLRYTTADRNRSQSTQLISLRRGAWTALAHSAVEDPHQNLAANGEISITLKQDLNRPPVLMATYVKTGQSRELWDPNPQLAGVELGEVSIYKWHDKAGHEWSGGLVKPPDFLPGRRYPLVLQTHGFNATEFLTDGIYPTANAARALASRGIVVLQVSEITAVPPFTPQEADTNGRAGYDAAIQQLSQDGIINSQKVGIIGFSHTGWFVLDALLHNSGQYRAATLAESSYQSFSQYLVNTDYHGSVESDAIADSVGSKPFGDGIKTWLAASPGFNTDKITVPILFEENDPVALVDCWDIYAALRLQAKPVELLYMRNGQHVLTKPAELFASQEITVDWYDFWLNRHEDPDPAKAEQYIRWRKLRQLENAD